MNWTKLIQTMGRQKIYWDYINAKVVLFNGTILICTPLLRLPPELVNIAKKGDASLHLAQCSGYPRHECSFTGHSFERNKRILLLYTANNVEQPYPVLIYRKYIELFGASITSIYASGSPTRPIRFETQDLCTAYICPARIYKEDAERFARFGNLLAEGAIRFG